MALTRAQKVRYAIYAAGTTVAFLLVADGVIRFLEAQGVLDTRRADDAHLIRADPWVARGDWLVPDKGLVSQMAEHRLRRVKGDAIRVFLLGGSFMKGVPLTGEGTIHWWLADKLRERNPQKRYEIANASMSATPSAIVRQVADYALQHEPDAVVVASCNNEGTLPPSQVTQRLHDLGTFRLMRSMLRDDDVGRPAHTPQDPDIDAVRARFRENLEHIVEVTREAGVPLLLCTLPLNLLYAGNEAGLPLDGHAWEEQGSVEYAPCGREGIQLYQARRYEEAIQALRSCEDVEALRWTGLSRYASGQMEPARVLLEQYAELVPRNRCRPTFNDIIRDVARAGGGHVTLVDLDALARSRSAGGLPGPEMFVDYCHLDAEAQGMVAEAIYRGLAERGLATPRLGP